MAYELKLLPKQQLLTALYQVLNPTYLQTLKLLYLPYPDLLDEINKEIENNVILEMKKQDELINFARQHIFSQEKRKGRFIDEVTGGIKTNLYEHLLFQLDLEKLDPESFQVGKKLIENIDQRGFIEDYEKVRQELIKNKNLDVKRIDKILNLIQTFEPEGVGARNLKECLLIQLKQFALDEEVEEKLAIIIRKNLPEIAKKDFSKIAKNLNLPEEAVKAMADFISEHLNPNPGGGFGSETQEFIIPSFSWEGNEKETKISNLETSKGPNLTLSHYYLNILENPQTDNNTLKFLKEKLEKAKIFLKDIVKRQQTLEQIVQKVCKSQVAFLNGEKHFLTPILQKDLAQIFNLHTSYVSRALSGKYIQTPRGIFPLKYLCSRSNRGRSISEIMFAVKNIIEKENKKKPLTDTQVQKELEKQGFFLARRTVAKYRSKAGLSTKGKRK